MPWRKTDVKYAQNEVYVDIIEEIDAIIDKHGAVVSSEASGRVYSNIIYNYYIIYIICIIYIQGMYL